MLAEEYELSNVKKSLYYRKIYDSVNEEMFGMRKVQNLQKTLGEEQRRQQQLQEGQIKKENLQRQYGFIAGLGVMLLVAFILFKNNLEKRKANVLLHHQKEKVETTLQELKSTQTQLIQSEKMASLGEITAGIAHEIQNPLNFINNFAQVNEEYIEEAKGAIKSGKTDDAIDILNNLEANQKRINQHGQRADSIVKGMLQHSRSSSGQKEPTDINALVDEYVRLSYHGWKAKDKFANITLKKSLDASIKTINVVPQDIGRVILNLTNNAFYAVSEKKKTQPGEYEPTVEVSSAQFDHKVEIRIKDNGNGIPETAIKKIFQPFFTTKPTGQGTGLGLSLSYDIISKEHSGAISVDSSPGEGAEFKIQLPLT
jgi:signal transduction histidine kinase